MVNAPSLVQAHKISNSHCGDNGKMLSVGLNLRTLEEAVFPHCGGSVWLFSRSFMLGICAYVRRGILSIPVRGAVFSVHVTKELKMYATWQLYHYAAPRPPTWCKPIFTWGSPAQRNESCQISSLLVQGFGALGVRKSPFSFYLRHCPYNSVTH